MATGIRIAGRFWLLLSLAGDSPWAQADDPSRSALQEIDAKRNELQAKIDLYHGAAVELNALTKLAEWHKDLYLLDFDDPRTRLGAALAMQNDASELVTEILFDMVLQREPTDKEADRCQEHLAKHRDEPKQAIEDILWALCNTKEFVDRLRR